MQIPGLPVERDESIRDNTGITVDAVQKATETTPLVLTPLAIITTLIGGSE
ncbi:MULTISPECIES: hypothetical protein [unclassified Cryobacterium]|uniref:hypothetical protein n=1 Tax=Cryobacterium sp. Y50 TaxID=2048286 RepID=UPI0018EC28D3